MAGPCAQWSGQPALFTRTRPFKPSLWQRSLACACKATDCFRAQLPFGSSGLLSLVHTKRWCSNGMISPYYARHMVATAPTGAAAAHRILVAEDDETARVMLQRYLEAKGNAVVSVADGQAALDALDALGSDGAYDLVILDAMMPQVNGFEVLERVRARGDFTPIIMATAMAK